MLRVTALRTTSCAPFIAGTKRKNGDSFFLGSHPAMRRNTPLFPVEESGVCALHARCGVDGRSRSNVDTNIDNGNDSSTLTRYIPTSQQLEALCINNTHTENKTKEATPMLKPTPTSNNNASPPPTTTTGNNTDTTQQHRQHYQHYQHMQQRHRQHYQQNYQQQEQQTASRHADHADGGAP